MATDWKSKYGDGKWVTIRGAHVYVQEGAGLRSALSKLNGKKKKITSPVRKIPKLDDSAKKIIKKNEQTIVNAQASYKKALDSNNPKDSEKAYFELGKAENAHNLNRKLKGRNNEPELVRRTGAADYNNAKKPSDSFNSWFHNGHELSVKAGIKDARAAREASGTNGKLRSPVYADQNTGKLKLAKSNIPGKLTANAIGKNRLEKNFEGIKVKRNEDIIKRYNKANPSKMDWGEYTKLDDAARIARDENRVIKEKRNPGRGQTVNDYRNPQFKKGDHYNLTGKMHVSSRVYPDASKTGAADQELNELYAQRIPHGNRTYTDKMIKGSWENQVKDVIKNARLARKTNGTEGKLRSDVYKDSPQQVAEKKARANKELKDSIFRQATAKATVNTEAIKKRGDARKATASANASAELKKLKNTPVKEEDENARLKRQIFLEATAAQKPAKEAATKSFVENRGPANKNQALIDASKGKTYIADLSKDDGKGTYTIVVPKESRIGGKSDPEGWKVYTGMKLKSKGDFGTTYDSEDGKIGKVTVENNPNGRFEKVYREPSTSPSLRQALQEKVDAQKQPATPTRAKKSAKADTASNEAFIQRWSKPTEGRKWMEANNQITSLRTQVQQMKASGKSTAALEAKIKKLTHENLLRYGKYGPDDE
ncbi:hypothetical protein [Stecheria intestinalis]|uniref:hypothetical protein n=1 Tax=Stecheria intestinalis TaxID=2606630 RepID=UPI0023EFC4C7|nr:hypothetical protein [Stecheria intestinalis]MDD5880969.1 hypothetical protein [Stecheria intestinalis]